MQSRGGARPSGASPSRTGHWCQHSSSYVTVTVTVRVSGRASRGRVVFVCKAALLAFHNSSKGAMGRGVGAVAAVQREALREPAVQMPGGEHCVSVAVRGQAGCAAQTVEPSAKIPPCWLFTTQQGARSWPLAPGFRSPARVLEHLQAGHSGCRERRRATGRTCARACSAQSRWAASPPRLCWHRGVRHCADSCRWPWAGIAIGQKGVASDDGAGRWCCPWSGCAGGARGAVHIRLLASFARIERPTSRG